MRGNDGRRARLGREAVGMLLEIGLALLMMGIAALIALLATRGNI